MEGKRREATDLRDRLERIRLRALVLIEESRRISERLSRVLRAAREGQSVDKRPQTR